MKHTAKATDSAAKLPGALCADCPGRSRALIPAEPATGKTHLIVISESPGWQELEQRKPLVGGDGRLIERMLRHFCGLRRNQVHLTHAVCCDVERSDLPRARKCCAPRLVAELAAVDGSAPVAALGSTALHSSIASSRKPAILEFRGSVIDADDQVRGAAAVPRRILPTLDPWLVLRAPHWQPVLETDFQRIGHVLRDGYVRPENVPGRTTIFPHTTAELKVALAGLDRNVAVDVETTGLDMHTVKLVCFVISDTKTSVVVPWSRDQAGNGNYFNGSQGAAREVVNAALRQRCAITHNGPGYDHTLLERYGFKLGDWDDTLLAYHVYTSNFPKRLQHVASCFADVPPWKQWDHGTNLHTLWEYCGRDGLYTALSWQALRPLLDEDDVRVYESDKRSATLCKQMSQNGFLFDTRLALKMSSALRAEGDKIAERAAELCGVHTINLLAPSQLADAMFKRLGARCSYYSDSGKPCFNAEAMRGYAASMNEQVSELALLVLQYRSTWKCRKTYVDNIRPHADGRVRPNWQSFGTVSGRWACAAGWTKVLTTAGWQSLSLVVPGDHVWTHRGRWRRVSHTLSQGVQQVFDVRLSTGAVLTCTADHRLLGADNKWVKVGVIHEHLKKVGQRLRQSVCCCSAVPVTRAADKRRNCQTIGHDSAQHHGRIATLHVFGRAAGASVCATVDEQCLPEQGEVWFSERQLEGGLRRRVWLLDSTSQRKEAVCAPHCHGPSVGTRRAAAQVGRAPYRRGSEQQQFRQLSACNADWAPHYSLSTGQGFESIAVEEIYDSGSCAVYDLTVEDDESYVTEGVISHNCRGPNLANLPRPANDAAFKAGLGGIRSLYHVAPGRKLVSFDVSQMEWRVAAHVTDDPVMIAACSGDIHAANATLLFGEAFTNAPHKAQRDNMRTLAKTAGFATCYLAETPTVHARLVLSGVDVTLQATEAMLLKLRRSLRVYYQWQADNLSLTIKRGYVESPILKRKRWLGHSPSPPENANFPIQSGAADVFNLKAWELQQRIKHLDALPVAAVYDALYLDVAEAHVDEVVRHCSEVWAEPISIGSHDVVLPIDLKVGDRWS